jgi:hypothetical protein
MKRFIGLDGKEVSKSKKTDECLIFEPKENGITVMTKMLPTDEQLAKASDWLVEWGGSLDVSKNGSGVTIGTDPNTFTVKLKGEKITEAAEEQISNDWINWVGQFAEEKAKADSAKPEEDPKPAEDPKPTAKPAEDPKPKEDPKPTAKPAEEDPDPGPTDSGKGSSSPFVAGEKPYWEEPQEKWGEMFDRQVDFYLKQYEETAS